ncbi:MAG: cytochrome b/b6 domain-containing protein [Ferrovibrio sp.]|uniref:cytochrome b/b6 domain-containing protein n=1 Tax=Ferrovibrio sp. TaxID=1917215 RepID=UPI0026173743|nr:cytochrome b/b6 domain-containing protein [Ferrovibrio sp.]MCW0234751.1 cytochrome b/b6 domain-containing protein [Ferrovibrio sp.]
MTIETPHSASGSPAAKPGFVPIRVWDLPTRLFHWGLVALVIAMVWTGWQGKLDLHMTLGQVVLSLVLFRLIWGFAGNRYARFTDFVAGPMAGLRYLGTLFGRPGPKYIGHNPVGGYAVLAMLGLLALQAGTGLFTSDDIVTDGPLYSKVPSSTAALLGTLHRRTIWVLGAVIAVHLLSTVFYLTVKKENLVTPMVTGRKHAAAAADAAGGHPALALAIFAACLAVVFGGISLLK